MSVLEEVAVERHRQQMMEGWTPPHDDAHKGGQMAGAAACYAMHGLSIGNVDLQSAVRRAVRDLWPWSEHWWKPTDRRRDLVKAAALIVAEIERLDRAAASQSDAA